MKVSSETSYTFDRKELQSIINATFEMVMKAHAGELPQDREKTAEWVASQLRDLGIDTYPMGMSWGILR